MSIIVGTDIPVVCKALGSFPKWYILGVQLYIPPEDLTIIDHNNLRDCDKCKYDMIAVWIDKKKATWTRLVEALKTIQHIAKATDIEQNFCKK